MTIDQINDSRMDIILAARRQTKTNNMSKQMKCQSMLVVSEHGPYFSALGSNHLKIDHRKMLLYILIGRIFVLNSIFHIFRLIEFEIKNIKKSFIYKI